MSRAPRVPLSQLPPELRRAARISRRLEREAEERRRVDHFARTVGIRPVAEYRFAIDAGRLWQIDVAFVDQRLALEIEGGVWTEGRHTRGGGFLDDMEKYNELAVRGWRLLRCTPEQLYTPETVALVRAALDNSGDL